MAATFMMKLVIILTKKAMLMIKTKPLDSLNMVSQLTAIHSAAPVCQRQKPMLMAPANSRMMFQGISSRSLMSKRPVAKEKNRRGEQYRCFVGRNEAGHGGFHHR